MTHSELDALKGRGPFSDLTGDARDAHVIIVALDERDVLVAEIERMDAALRALMDCQNGPPLTTYTEDWNAAMKAARAALLED